MGMKVRQPLVPWGWVGRAVCQQHGWDGCAMCLAGATSMCGGTDSPQIWGMQREMCFHPKNGSVVSCAVGVGKHHVEEQKGNLGGIRKLADKKQLILAESRWVLSQSLCVAANPKCTSLEV